MSEIRYKLKILKHYIQRNWGYYREKTRLGYYPLILLVETTNFCNLRCTICPQNGVLKRPRGYMSIKLYKKIIEDIKGRIPWVMMILGGEPLLHKALPEMISIAKKNGIKTEIYTNATLLDTEMSRKLLNAGLNRITISFDGENIEHYEKVRKGAKYQKTLSNIISFLEERKRLKSGVYVVIQTVKMYGKDRDLRLKKEFKALFKGYKINEFRVFYAHSWAGKTKDFDYNTVPRRRKNYIHCDDLWTKMAVSWDGLAVPCCLDLNADLIMGDVNKVNTLSIWNSDKMIGLRKKLIDGRFSEIGLCRECERLFEEKIGIDRLFFNIYRIFRKPRL